MGNVTTKEAAGNYVAHGWYIFPVCPPTESEDGKKPLITAWQQRATCDRAQIDDWWQKWPDANIGLACGLSKIIAIDIDPRHGGTLEALNLSADDERTVTSQTGGGGLHLLYRVPPNRMFGNSRGGLPGGIDVRGSGGYIVLPPSIHMSRMQYRWKPGCAPDELRIKPLPETIVELILSQGRLAAERMPEVIEEGRRNVLLTSLAGSMRKRNACEDAILAALKVQNELTCAPPLPDVAGHIDPPDLG